MNEDQIKALLKETFNRVSAGYDGQALRYFSSSAQHLANLLELKGHERVLDVATGTGHAAISIAANLPEGHVTGVDFSEGMLEIAKQKAALRNTPNIEFREMDMQNLAFAAGSFDIALSSFGIFFVEDIDRQLLEIALTVRPGGKVAITCFKEKSFDPQFSILCKNLSDFGVEIPAKTQPWEKIATEKKCQNFFNTAGLLNVQVQYKNLGYHLSDAQEWWDIVWNAGYRRLVSQLPADKLESFKVEHLREIDSLRTDDGIWLDVGVLFAVGTVQTQYCG